MQTLNSQYSAEESTLALEADRLLSSHEVISFLFAWLDTIEVGRADQQFASVLHPAWFIVGTPVPWSQYLESNTTSKDAHLERIDNCITCFPPEFLECGTDSGLQADFYALGVFAYKLLTGKHPYKVGAVREWMDRAVLGLKPLFPLSGFPPDFTIFIETATSLDPSDRFVTASEVRRALLAIVANSSTDPM